LESVTVKLIRERLQSGIGQPGVWPASHPLGPLASSLCTLPAHVRCIPMVTLILVEFQISLYFLEMLQFGTFVPEIK
jgi:hypothetical protein